MLPLLFAEMGATAPAGHNGGITMTQAYPNWTATAWFGGTNLGSFTQSRQSDAYQRALIVLSSYWVDVFYGSVDPDN